MWKLETELYSVCKSHLDLNQYGNRNILVSFSTYFSLLQVSQTSQGKIASEGRTVESAVRNQVKSSKICMNVIN